MAGDDEADLQCIGVADKMGFETAVGIPGKFKCVKLGAVRGDAIIRYSNLACSVRQSLHSWEKEEFGTFNTGKPTAIEWPTGSNEDAVGKDYSSLISVVKAAIPTTWESYESVAYIAAAVAFVGFGMWVFVLGRAILRQHSSNRDPILHPADL